MSHKIQIVLPDPQADQLAELATGTGEPPSTLAGLFVRHGIAQAAKDGKVRQLRQAPAIAGSNGVRARWLEPYGGDPPGGGRCGARSSLYTAATPAHSRTSKTTGGQTTSTPRCFAH